MDDPNITPSQAEAARHIRNAAITLGCAEDVFTEATGRMVDAIRAGLAAGIALPDIRRLASDDDLRTLARWSIHLAIQDETQRLKAAVEAAEAAAVPEGGKPARQRRPGERHRQDRSVKA